MCKKLIYLCMCMLVLALAGSNAALGETADIQIAAGTDDAEQHLGDARMDIGSTDLEFAYEDGGDPTTDEQVVGLRFVGIPLDPGAFVMDTYIEIEVDKVDKEGSQAPVNVIIEGQLALDASEFVDDANNITDRPTTTAKVMWSIPEWTEESAKFQSPDLSSIIQEIIDQEGWTSGNAIVLIIRDDKDNPSTGLREAESFEGEAGAAALLHLDYAIPVIFETRIADELDDAEEDLNPSKLGEMDETSSDLELAYEDDNMGDPQLVGVRFREIAIPANSPITEAWVRFQVKETRSGTLPVNLIIEGQLDLNPDAFSGGGPGTFNISSRPRTVASIQWSVPSWENVGDSGAAQTTVNIAPIIQELVNQDGWASGNALVLIFSDDPCNPSEGLRNAHAGVGNDSALLHIEAIIDIATNPEPANGAVGVLLGSTLSWKPIPVGATREVYFGTTNPPALVSVQEGTSYYPGPIDPNTTYYWQVDEVEADGTTVHAGDIWSFTTGLSNLRTDTGIADENDDGEDHIAHGDAVDDGAESRGSSDLEMPWDNDEPDLRQVVGLRFRDMPIPQGAPITEAYVQFTADNENLDGGPVNLIISGLLVPDTGALGGGENFFERGPKTVAEVAWTDIPEWTSSQATAASRTPDISSIIQEIVNQDGWAPGNAIMLFIRDDETNPSADNRSALSMSAVLHVPVSNSVPTQPSPANGAEEVPVDTMLNWWPGLDAVSHEVYLWTDSPLQSLPLLVTTPEVTVNPGDLLRGTTYYWQVVAITADADASVSDIWSFSTPAIKATKPTPADGAVELLNPVALSWAAPQGAVEYAVYLSDDAVIDEADLLGSGEAVEYALPELNLGKTYYWRVDTTHEDLTVVEGDVWQFTMFPNYAYGPMPSDGGMWQIGTDTELSWTAGMGAVLHHAYVSTDKSLVDARDMSVATMFLSTNSHNPGELTPGTIYYWAVDEFGPAGTISGATWSFETSGL